MRLRKSRNSFMSSAYFCVCLRIGTVACFCWDLHKVRIKRLLCYLCILCNSLIFLLFYEIYNLFDSFDCLLLPVFERIWVFYWLFNWVFLIHDTNLRIGFTWNDYKIADKIMEMGRNVSRLEFYASACEVSHVCQCFDKFALYFHL